MPRDLSKVIYLSADSKMIYLSSEQFTGLDRVIQDLASPFTGYESGQEKQLFVPFINVRTILFMSKPYVTREGDYNVMAVKMKLIDGSLFTLIFKETEGEETHNTALINANSFIIFVRTLLR